VSDCAKQKLKKHKSALPKVAERRVTSAKKRLINQRDEFLLPLLTAVLPTLANLLFRKRAKEVFPIARQAVCQLNMLRKMYLVSADKYHKPSQHPPSYGKTNKKKSKKPLVTNTLQNKNSVHMISGSSYWKGSKKQMSNVRQ